MADKREELQELIRTEPTIAGTLAELEGPCAKAVHDAKALTIGLKIVQDKMAAIAAAKAELAGIKPKAKVKAKK